MPTIGDNLLYVQVKCQRSLVSVINTLSCGRQALEDLRAQSAESWTAGATQGNMKTDVCI